MIALKSFIAVFIIAKSDFDILSISSPPIIDKLARPIGPISKVKSPISESFTTAATIPAADDALQSIYIELGANIQAHLSIWLLAAPGLEIRNIIRVPLSSILPSS